MTNSNPPYYRYTWFGAENAGSEFISTPLYNDGLYVGLRFAANSIQFTNRFVWRRTTGWSTVPVVPGDVFMVSINVENPTANVASGTMYFASLFNCTLLYDAGTTGALSGPGNWQFTLSGIFVATGYEPAVAFLQQHSNVSPCLGTEVCVVLAPTVIYEGY